MFHFGLLTAILDGWSFEEAVDTAAEMGLNASKSPAGRQAKRSAAMREFPTLTQSACWQMTTMPPM